MSLARKWVCIGLTYYFLRACIIIYPMWTQNTQGEQWLIIAQSVLGIFILTIVLYSFKYDIGPIVWSLYLQAILFILSNFNIYRAKNYNNYIGLNNLASMFSVVFTVTNTLLASMVSE